MAALWGSTFFLSKDVMTRLPVPDLLTWRFGLALVAMVVAAPRALRMSARTLRQGLVLGAVLTAGQLAQTWGLAHTTASANGFLTGLYLVATPVIAWAVTRHRVSPTVWLAVGLATGGLAALSIVPGGTGTSAGFGWGELVTLAGAICFGGHIVAMGRFATARTSLSLTIVQTAVLVGVSAVWAAPGGIAVPVRTDWFTLAYLALIAGALTLFAQAWAQAHIEPTRAAVIMVSEPVWAAALAVGFGGEHLTSPMLIGGLAITAAAAAVIVPESVITGAPGRLAVVRERLAVVADRLAGQVAPLRVD